MFGVCSVDLILLHQTALKHCFDSGQLDFDVLVLA